MRHPPQTFRQPVPYNTSWTADTGEASREVTQSCIQTTRMTTFGVLPLLVAIAYIHGIGAQPFTVNNQRLAGCDTNNDFSLKAAVFDTDAPANPCTGYLNLDVVTGTADIRRLCSLDGGGTYNRFHKQAAERYCYMLGVNMYRPASGNLQEQVKLFECKEATGSTVDVPENGGTENTANVDDASPGASVGELCHAELANSDCYDNCYRGTTTYGPTHVSGDENDCYDATITDLHPFWAVTCSDINECAVGVQYGCSDPFTCYSRVACGPNADCTNLVGSYTCSCPAGYESANGNDADPYDLTAGCTDINECDTAGVCGPQSQCYNYPGTYDCVCQNLANYDEANNICLPVTCPQLPIMLNARPTASLPASPQLDDSVIYLCVTGYEVRPERVPSPLIATYGYDPATAYAVTCTEDATWEPEPFGMCQRISCGDPGIVAFANRTGSSFLYEDEVTFVCKDGFDLKEYANRREFDRTCEADSEWTRNYECTDINECDRYEDLCSGVTRHCINTIGSYYCSCVPWSEQDGSEEQCLEWGGLIDFPRYEPCEMVERLGLCTNGKCEMDDGKAYCRCNMGYEGDSCDRWTIGRALIIAIVALVLIAIVIIICLLCICTRWICRPGRLVRPPAYPAPVSASYGGIMRRPLKPGRPLFY